MQQDRVRFGRYRVKPLMILFLMVFAGGCSADAQSFEPHDARSPLQLIRVIDLPNVKGRIDHMAIDPAHNHLFVAEYANGSVDQVDLATGKVVGRITGLHDPQGIEWLPVQQEIAVASGDGALTFYRGTDRQKVAVVGLGDDADNIRVDRRNGNLVVGFGSGALAVIDPATHRVIRQITLPGHPEAFELLGSRIFANVPDAHKILIGDVDQGRITATLGTGPRFGNFPMASNAAASLIAVAYRVPGSLVVLDAHSGAALYSAPICGDADDLYFRSSQIVAICGSGAVELVDETGQHLSVRVATARGARTGILDMRGGRLFVAVPARLGSAAIWELKFR